MLLVSHIALNKQKLILEHLIQGDTENTTCFTSYLETVSQYFSNVGRQSSKFPESSC